MKLRKKLLNWKYAAATSAVFLFLVAFLFLLLASSAYAEQLTFNELLTDFNIEFNSESSLCTASESNGRLTVSSATTEGVDSLKLPKFTPNASTLTITNISQSDTILFFDYHIYGKGYTVIDGITVNGPGFFCKKVAAGENVEISITSLNFYDGTETIVISNLQSIEDSQRNILFNDSNGGTITVNNNVISDSFSVNSNYDTGINVSATPSSGYSFLYWVDENNVIISDKQSGIIRPTSDMVVRAVFASNSEPVFRVGNTVFLSLDEATSFAANSADKLVILVKSSTLPSGTYVIPNGVTLLIPFDNSFTYYTDTPGITGLDSNHITPYAFCQLTLSDNSEITVESGGAISVPSKLSALGTGTGSWNATPTGPHGRIHIPSSSSIVLNSGASLFSFGYISGEGVIDALQGSTVWEAFQIRSWRGGSATIDLIGKTPCVFPMNQYYIQNIEAKLKIHYGATENVYTAINALSKQFVASAQFIGPDGLFRLANGYILKCYDGENDYLIFDVDGDLTLSSLSISNLPLINRISSSDVESLSICNNISINIQSGTTLIGENISLLPGCKISVSQNATLSVNQGKKMIIYDHSSWGKYAFSNTDLICVGYSTVNGGDNIRTSANLTDVQFDINGEIFVYGSMLTTGTSSELIAVADITSSQKTGCIVFYNTTNETATYQALQASISGESVITIVEIPVTSAKLHNADGSYTLTDGASGGDTYVYCPYCDVWGLDEDHAHTGTVIWENWDETELMREDVAYGVVPEYTGTTPEKVSNDPRFNYVFHDWYQTRTEVSGEVTKYTAEFKAFSTDPAQTNNALKFTTAALTLENDITVNFKIKKNAVDNAGFNLLYTIFTVNNEAKIVTGYEKDGYYVFDCKGVFPKYLNNRIFATLYAEKDGTLYTATTSYRAATYCYSLFNNPGTDAPELLKKLAVDTLLYGEAAQLHFNYRTDALCTSKLTAEHMAYASTSTGELVNRLSIEKTIETASASWKAATLFLNNSIDFRFQFSHTNGTEGLYAIMTDTVTGRTWRVSSFESAKDSNTGNVIADNYWVFFKGLNASQMNNEVEVVIYNADNEQISRTLHYSIESYVKYTVENSTNEKLLNLVECIIKYGNSAKAYVNRNN